MLGPLGMQAEVERIPNNRMHARFIVPSTLCISQINSPLLELAATLHHVNIGGTDGVNSTKLVQPLPRFSFDSCRLFKFRILSLLPIEKVVFAACANAEAALPILHSDILSAFLAHL
jgi:hypothetical protein